jgi:hypothetical protein
MLDKLKVAIEHCQKNSNEHMAAQKTFEGVQQSQMTEGEHDLTIMDVTVFGMAGFSRIETYT